MLDEIVNWNKEKEAEIFKKREIKRKKKEEEMKEIEAQKKKEEDEKN